jgi:hypothetical protein
MSINSNSYCDNYIKVDKMGGFCSTHMEIKNVYSILVGKHEGKSLLIRPRHRWDQRIHVFQDRDRWLAVMNMVMNLLAP